MEFLKEAFLPTKLVRRAEDVEDDELLKMGREQERFAIYLYETQAKRSWVQTIFDPLLRIVVIEEDHERQFMDALKRIGGRPYDMIPFIRFAPEFYQSLERLPRKEMGEKTFLQEALEVVTADHFQEVFASLHYQLGADWAKDPGVSQLFKRIKRSEDAHQRAFEALYARIVEGKVTMFCPFCGEVLDAAGHCWACGMNFRNLALE